MKNIDITFDPSKDEVLGVFGEEVHILCGFFEDPNTNDEECIVIKIGRAHVLNSSHSQQSRMPSSA